MEQYIQLSENVPDLKKIKHEYWNHKFGTSLAKNQNWFQYHDGLSLSSNLAVFHSLTVWVHTFFIRTEVEGGNIKLKFVRGNTHFEKMTIGDVMDWSRYWRVNYKIQLWGHHSTSFYQNNILWEVSRLIICL